MTDIVTREGDILSVTDEHDRSFRWTTKKRKFVYHLARCADLKEAATRAGYASNTSGGKLVSEAPIQRAVGIEIRNILQAELENEESVIARWSRWANVDVGAYFNPDWNLKDNAQLTEDQLRCIKKVKIAQTQHGRNIDIEFHDAHRANNDLATFLGMLGKQEDHPNAPDELAKFIRGALEEMDATDSLQQQDTGSANGGTPTAH